MARPRRPDGYPGDAPYVGTRVHEVDKQRLTQAAEELGITVSDILRNAMRAALDAHEDARSAGHLSAS
jgi:hypothetical protein